MSGVEVGGIEVCTSAPLTQALAPDANDDLRPLYVGIRVEGWGSVYGFEARQFVFVSRKDSGMPSHYIPALRAWPSELEHSAEILGGTKQASELTFELRDSGFGVVDDEVGLISYLTKDNRSTPYALLADLAPGDTVIDFGLPVPSELIVWLGSEAILLQGISSGTVLNCARGQLGTTAQQHLEGAPVFFFPFFVDTRRVTFLYGHIPGEEIEEDAGTIDTLEMTDDLLGWRMATVSLEQFFDRLLARVLTQTQEPRWIQRLTNYPSRSVLSPTVFPLLSPENTNTSPFVSYEKHGVMTYTPVWEDGWRFWKLEDEVLGLKLEVFEHESVLYTYGSTAITNQNTPTLYPGLRGLCGTNPKEHKSGIWAHECLIADADLLDPITGQNIGQFRYQREGGVGDPIVDDHVLTIACALLTSPNDPDDGLERGENYVSGQANYSWLPIGWGLGLHADRIDWQAVADLRAERPYLRAPNFHLSADDTERSFRELWDERFAWTGIVWVHEQGLWAPKIAVGDLLGDVVPPANALAVRVADSQHPSYRVAKRFDLAFGAVQFTFDDDREPYSFDDRNIARIFDRGGVYTKSRKPVVIDATVTRNAEYVLALRALQLILRAFAPMIEISWRSKLSDVAGLLERRAIAHARLPHPTGDGIKGWTNESVIVTSRRRIIRPDEIEIHYKALRYSASTRAARISASARVVSFGLVSGSWRFVVEGASFSELQDSAKFTSGLRVTLRDAWGVPLASGYQTTTGAIGADWFEVDGNFSAFTVLPNMIVCLAQYNAQSDDAKARYAFHAEDTLTVGGSDPAYEFSE